MVPPVRHAAAEATVYAQFINLGKKFESEMQLSDEDRWSSFVDTIKSRDRYRRSVVKYQTWCTAKEITWEDPRHVEQYIVEMHSNYLEKPKSENSFCGKT